MENQETTVGGVPVRWLEHGSGRPVVLVHGIPTSPALWRHVMPLVRAGAWLGRCVATAPASPGASGTT
jgi:pimeloyl-ACP methyl ester carboxylesterase